MTTIGTLTIKDQNDIVALRNKVRLMATTLLFSKMEVTRMASLISELSREISLHTLPFEVSVSLSQKDVKCLYYHFSCTEKLKFSKNSPMQRFFDSIKNFAERDNGYKIAFGKILSDQSLQIDDALITQVKTDVLHLSEKDLLRELERTNQELTKAYETLERSQKELLNRTQQLAKVGGWEINLDDMSLSWTEEVFRIHELPSNKRPKVEDGINFYAPEARPKISKAVMDGIEKGIAWDLELPFITAKGNRKWVRAIGYPERNQSKTIRLSGVIQDITAQKEAELKLERRNQELNFKNKELEQFVYIASHDLQEPLRTMSSYIDLLGRLYQDKLDDKALRFIEHIKWSSLNMTNLIRDLLDYSRIGRKKAFTKVDCNKVVQTVLSEIELVIHENQASVQVGRLPNVTGLEVELKQLFQNLISNAIKFRKENQSPEVKLTVREERDTWHFMVQDKGIGMAKEHLERIFSIFQRLHTKDEYPGTGIGLALCKKITELHQGKIWVESKLNQGSIFNFTLAKNPDPSSL